MSDPILTVGDTPDPAAEAAIIEGLRGFNHAMLGTPSDVRPLQVVVRDPETQAPLGGVSGHTLRGLLFVDFVFLPEALRGTGLAARRLGRAEAEAQQRGCTAAVLYTLNPRSPTSTPGSATAPSAPSRLRRRARAVPI